MDYRDIEWFALETNRDHSVVFEIASKYCISNLLLTMMAAAAAAKLLSHVSRVPGILQARVLECDAIAFSPSSIKPPKNVLFIIGDWNTKVGSQEIPGVTGKFGLGVQNEAGQRLTEFCQENTLIIANSLF